jgi:elongator complex protein 3
MNWQRRRATQCGCIRCREINATQCAADELELRINKLQNRPHAGALPRIYQRKADSPQPGLTIGFLRLSLPLASRRVGSRAFLPEIAESAMIREVHVYGTALSIGGESSDGDAQHVGLGTQLIDAKPKSHQPRRRLPAHQRNRRHGHRRILRGARLCSRRLST